MYDYHSQRKAIAFCNILIVRSLYFFLHEISYLYYCYSPRPFLNITCNHKNSASYGMVIL